MPKRHRIRPGDLESIIGRLQELVLANSGEDEFEEIIKLLVAKLYSEMHSPEENAFQVSDSTQNTARYINGLLAQATSRWKGIIQGPPVMRLTEEHLAVCVEALQDQSLLDSSLEVLDGAFEYLISRVAKGSKGQFFTPRHVVDCCVKMINPSPTEVVIDPACGSGGFLIHTLNHIREHSPSVDIPNYCQSNLWGCDFDRRAIQIAKALMLIAGDGNANLFQLNSLLTDRTNPSFFNELDKDAIPRLTIEDVTRSKLRNFKGFDVVLTNPPFAGEIRESHILENYQLHKKGRRVERDVLFLERCVNLLKPGGRLGIVLPHNKFAAPTWAYMREWLIRNLQVVAVLGLGRNTFLPHTHQKASILFGIKREKPIRELPNEDILFLISEKDGKDSKGQIVALPKTTPDDPAWTRADHDLSEFIPQFQEFCATSKIAWRAI